MPGQMKYYLNEIKYEMSFSWSSSGAGAYNAITEYIKQVLSHKRMWCACLQAGVAYPITDLCLRLPGSPEPW